ncbi:helix-turn-helix transcriptional regulator [Rhodococcus jostii]|uniref:helix-turn-helix transcriptional regulator n=1 Tax=Rhodococcus jostii TaxID=132919 RepID=UPI00362DDC38
MQIKDPGQIRRWRKQRKYSQRELGMLVRRSQTAIYKIETGQLRNISEAFAMAIANRLDVPWEELFVAHESVIAHSASIVRADTSHPISA